MGCVSDPTPSGGPAVRHGSALIVLATLITASSAHPANHVVEMFTKLSSQWKTWDGGRERKKSGHELGSLQADQCSQPKQSRFADSQAWGGLFSRFCSLLYALSLAGGPLGAAVTTVPNDQPLPTTLKSGQDDFSGSQTFPRISLGGGVERWEEGGGERQACEARLCPRRRPPSMHTCRAAAHPQVWMLKSGSEILAVSPGRLVLRSEGSRLTPCTAPHEEGPQHLSARPSPPSSSPRLPNMDSNLLNTLDHHMLSCKYCKVTPSPLFLLPPRPVLTDASFLQAFPKRDAPLGEKKSGLQRCSKCRWAE